MAEQIIMIRINNQNSLDRFLLIEINNWIGQKTRWSLQRYIISVTQKNPITKYKLSKNLYVFVHKNSSEHFDPYLVEHWNK
jgi:hypothetical protein